MTGAPVLGPGDQPTTSNSWRPRGLEWSAKYLATYSWLPERKETANAPLSSTVWWIAADWFTQTSTSGGDSETEVNEFAVMPQGVSRPAQSTVTPVAKRLSTWRSGPESG